MINFNGNIQENQTVLDIKNRGFLFGDAIFETVKVANNSILFAEDHYFRLMASMRICRMEIPMNFTLEFFEEQILAICNVLNISSSCRARITFYRESDGFYLPKSNDVSFIVYAESLHNKEYLIDKDSYEVELYKDFYVTKHLLSTIKTTNKMINVTGSIFANENDYDNCILLNDDKNVVEALNGNIFMKIGNIIFTPPISDGCLNGIMRKQVINLIKKIDGYECVEKSISPFDLQKSDELFLTNVITGIQPITKYRKKEYDFNFSTILIEKLNELI
jgi:branched-chain amino acid aminotransferase